MGEEKKLVVDVDGTIYVHDFPKIGDLIAGAKEAFHELSERGWSFIVWSCRNNPTIYRYIEDRTKNLEKLRLTMKEDGFPKVDIDDGSKGKAFGAWYVDDRGILFENNWDDIIKKINYKKSSNLLKQRHTVTVNIGVEDCILDESNNLVPGSSKALVHLTQRGYRIILSTIRSNRLLYDSEQQRNDKLSELSKILKENRVSYHWLDKGSIGKMVADYYIEPNMIPFDGSWKEVVKKIYA